MTRRNRIVLCAASLSLAAGLGYAIRAAASGIPATNALSYAGVLEGASGPINGSHNIQVILYDAATGGNNLCQSLSAAFSIQDGHFSVRLPDACTNAVGANPNVWADVLVDGSDTGRTKIGAVPYAVEAKHADTATNAAGALAQQIVPSGAVMAFDLDTCPTGWTEFTPVRGRTLVGTNPTGGTLSVRQRGSTFGEENHTMASSELAPHAHDLLIRGAGSGVTNEGYWNFNWTNGNDSPYGGQAALPPLYGGGLQNFMTVQPFGNATPFNNMQPSLALLYYHKD